MITNPLVSVIIPTYNNSHYFIEAIESVLAQTYQNYEIIVVDDGSTDDTKSLLQPYLDRIQYIYKTNGGVSTARNVGIRASKGKYLAFLDSDDLWLLEKLYLQVKRFNMSPELAVVFTDNYAFNESGITCPSNKQRYGVHEGWVFEKLFLRNFIGNSTIMVKRECLNRIGLFDESQEISVVQDFNFLLRLARYFPFGYVGKVLMKYRIHKSNLSSDFEKMYTQDFINFEKIIALFSELNLKDAPYVKKGRARYRFNFGMEYFQRNALKKARKQFITAISFHPWYFRAWLYIIASFLPVVAIQFIRKIKRITK